MFLQKYQKKMRGIFVPGLVAGILIVGLLSVSVATITSTTFSTLGGAKTASQAQQFGQVESEYMKVMGYNNIDNLIHERKSMEDLIGEEGKKYQSKVELADTTSNGEGRTVKVLKINVYKGNEINSRYSEEIPLVSGLDYSEKFAALNNLIDALTNRVNALEINLSNLSNDLSNLANRVTRAENNIALINSNLDRLEQLIDNNADAIKANKAAIDKNTKDISDISKELLQVKGDISDLRTSLSGLSTRLDQEIADRKAADSDLRSSINNLQSQINDVKSDMASLKTSVDVITGRLNGKEFVRNKDKVNDISLNYENDDNGNKTIMAYVDGTKVPLSSQSGNMGFPDYNNCIEWIYNQGNIEQNYTAPTNGYLFAQIFGNINSVVNEAYIKVNNRHIFYPIIGTIGVGVGLHAVIPLSKGDMVSVKALSGSSNADYQGMQAYKTRLYFFPCK